MFPEVLPRELPSAVTFISLTEVMTDVLLNTTLCNVKRKILRCAFLVRNIYQEIRSSMKDT